jgi:hypothetical protein
MLPGAVVTDPGGKGGRPMEEFRKNQPRRPVRYYIVKTDAGDQPLVRSVSVTRPVEPQVAPIDHAPVVEADRGSAAGGSQPRAGRFARAAAAIRRHPHRW